jgi:transposase InsO family protein
MGSAAFHPSYVLRNFIPDVKIDLKGPFTWAYFNLYVIMDTFSRWMVAQRESAALASGLIQETCGRQGVQENQLTIHADRGSSMTSRKVAQLLADLGVTKTHSRLLSRRGVRTDARHFFTVFLWGRVTFGHQFPLGG